MKLIAVIAFAFVASVAFAQDGTTTPPPAGEPPAAEAPSAPAEAPAPKAAHKAKAPKGTHAKGGKKHHKKTE